MTKLQLLATFILLLCSMGCVSPSQAQPLTIRSLAKGAFSGLSEQKEEVIRDAADWEALWKKHALSRKDAAPAPKVDFTKEMVIAVTLGTRRTGGYSVEVTGAEIVNGKLVVKVRRGSPPQGAMTIQALTAPFDFVALPRQTGEVKFVDDPAPPKP